MNENIKKSEIYFVAIPITDQLQMFESMQNFFTRTIEQKIDTVRCVKAKDLHVTIAYIGLLSVNRVQDLLNAVKMATQKYVLIQKKASLYWQGEISLYNNALALTYGYDEGLQLLARMIRDALLKHEIFFDERFEFRPHLTISRIKPNYMVKNNTVKRFLHAILQEKHTFDLQPISVTNVGVYKSGEIEPFATFNCT